MSKFAKETGKQTGCMFVSPLHAAPAFVQRDLARECGRP